MRLVKARVQNYRSIRDTGEFSVEPDKTIMVGPNEAGKTAILQALQQLKRPEGVKKLNPLRDYPRALYSDLARGKVKASEVPICTGTFLLDEEDQRLVPFKLRQPGLCFNLTVYLNDRKLWFLNNSPIVPTYRLLKPDLARLVAHLDRGVADGGPQTHTTKLASLTGDLKDDQQIYGAESKALSSWLEAVFAQVDEDNGKEVARHQRLSDLLSEWRGYGEACQQLYDAMPAFVLFSNIFRVRPNIHLGHLAARLASGVMDDDQYDYGNFCLLKLLGFTADELSKLGTVSDPTQGDVAALEKYREQLDKRNYQLNAASVSLSSEIKRVWNPNESKGEASKLRLVADGQYLKVVVEDSVGVEVELDQRSEGFQWIVSFFVVFFSEAEGKHANSILLLDEPGLSLHALKQREFRGTLTRLSEQNQTIYTTHSPFLVGPDELDRVRVVEMTSREVGTKVHTSLTSSDPAALLPLQEALGYDLAQSLFSQQRNLVCEGLTDYWYVDATSALFASAGLPSINDKTALVPSNTASKVVYFATILSSNSLKVAALLDSDNAGDQAARQEVLVHRLGNKRILRTADYTEPSVPKAEIEDLLRSTLAGIAKAELSVDVTAEVVAQPDTPIVDLITRGGATNFKYKLAKAYVKWTRDHVAADLTEAERKGWGKLLNAVNAALK